MDRFCFAFGGEKAKLPVQYRIDWGVVQDKGVVAWAECKRRYHGRGKYPTLLLSLKKYMSGIALARHTNKPFVIVVEWDDGVFWSKTGPTHDIRMGGRSDRGDWQDQEPCVFIPTSNFKEVK